MAASEQLYFCTVLHDVAPQTWVHYQPLLDLCDALGIPLTLLVIPDYHGEGAIERFPAFCRAIERRLARGDEVVLHGYYHRDDVPLRLSPSDWVKRRVFTHEAEFHALPGPVVRERLERGLDQFQRLGWPVTGFVAPGWLPGAETGRHLRELGLRYTSDFRALIDLEYDRRLPAPVLVWSPRSPLRRLASAHWNRYRLHRFDQAPCLRLAIHPTDFVHPHPQRFWLDTAARLAALRQPGTKQQWIEQQAWFGHPA